MIKIIQGVFGYNNGKSITPKTSKDEPFSCDKATEKRLVALGVAEYVTEETPVETHAEATESVEVREDGVKEPTREELIAVFKEMKLKGNPYTMRTETLKAKIAEAAELVEDEDSIPLDEDTPSFDEVDGVEG